MRAHIIENGIVTNTIEVNSLDVIPGLVEATDGGIGWNYADGVFSAPVVPEPVPVVPESVTMRQARLALLAADLLDDVDTMIQSIGRAAAITWEFATEVQRNNELVIAVLTSKGFTENQIDDLFVSADKL